MCSKPLNSSQLHDLFKIPFIFLLVKIIFTKNTKITIYLTIKATKNIPTINYENKKNFLVFKNFSLQFFINILLKDYFNNNCTDNILYLDILLFKKLYKTIIVRSPV